MMIGNCIFNLFGSVLSSSVILNEVKNRLMLYRRAYSLILTDMNVIITYLITALSF